MRSEIFRRAGQIFQPEAATRIECGFFIYIVDTFVVTCYNNPYNSKMIKHSFYTIVLVRIVRRCVRNMIDNHKAVKISSVPNGLYVYYK